MPTRGENRLAWNAHDWSLRGEEWTPHGAWKRKILKWTIDRYLKRGARVLELGPGGGRWTEELLRFAPARLVLADIAEACLDICKQRFAAFDQIEYQLTDGRSLEFTGDRSIDFVWSFDCLVHVERDDVAGYFEHFRRILAPGGICILHYATIDRARGEDPRVGWRSNFTFQDMVDLVLRYKFKPLEDLYDPTLAHSNTSVAIFGADESCERRRPPEIEEN